MTIRLVGLMSLVLLLCLGASAFLVNHYQNQVMEEVARTISTVGQETLRTLDTHGLHDIEALMDELPVGAGGRWELRSDDADAADRRMRLLAAARPPTLRGYQGVVVFSRGESQVIRGIPGAGDGCDVTATGDVLVTKHGPLPRPGVKAEGQIVMDALADAVRERLFIRIEDIRTEGDFEGMTLHIPAWRQEGNHVVGEDAHPVDRVRAAAGDADVAGEDTPLHQEAIVLPIDTDDYRSLFASFQRRSLFMLLGIFMLGMILSASLAARFTRPARRLDAGIRRLSQGELDVEVEARGSDEIARLGRAFNDMTAKLRAGRRRERELNRREKLSALGRLAAGVAHDVRNPLHSINLTLQHLQETCRPREDERGAEFDRSLGIIRQEIRRLSRLVENFLRFARSDAAEKAPVQIPELLRETAQLVEKEAARRRVEVRVSVPGSVPDVLADAESVRSSVLNLVLNAFEAMPSGGALTLSARREAGEVIVEVVDSGAGIPAGEQERVFEFAYTTREGGNGLGLPMVHQVVVEDHGGRVSLDSSPGAGTRVCLAFPLPEAGVA